VSPDAASTAIDWAEAEGWNPGVDDRERFLEADPDAFVVAERDGEILATASCVLYDESYAFFGFYIVRPELRGMGIGTELFGRALERAGDRVVGLDGVLAQEGYYARRGFAAAHRNARWRMAAGGGRPDGLVELAEVPFEELLAFDTSVFGADRERFLRAWVRRPDGHALAVLGDGGLAGYGVLRRCRSGSKVGPLFAEDAEVAERLLCGMLAAAPLGDVFLDIPAANPRAHALHEGRTMERVFETVRMYRNGRPPEDLERVFGVTTFEFG
jgi:GNAT superfamily N-acetyltransferase